jgi:hypothetical protein
MSIARVVFALDDAIEEYKNDEQRSMMARASGMSQNITNAERRILGARGVRLREPLPRVFRSRDKINPRSLREAIVIGAKLVYRMVNEEDWPGHRSRKEIDEIKKKAQF